MGGGFLRLYTLGHPERTPAEGGPVLAYSACRGIVAEKEKLDREASNAVPTHLSFPDFGWTRIPLVQYDMGILIHTQNEGRRAT